MRTDIERKIAERFDELEGIFLEEIKISDPRVQTTLKFFGNVRGSKILDCGCGKGRFAKILSEMGAEVTGMDPSEKLLESAKKNVKNAKFFLGSASALPFSGESFDRILCVEVLEHVPNFGKAVFEMARVLKKGGKIIIIDKNKLSLHPKIFLPEILLKKILEMKGSWFYPRGFCFTERWFLARGVKKALENYCEKAESEYILGTDRKLFSLFPFLNLFIAWKGVKK